MLPSPQQPLLSPVTLDWLEGVTMGRVLDMNEVFVVGLVLPRVSASHRTIGLREGGRVKQSPGLVMKPPGSGHKVSVCQSLPLFQASVFLPVKWADEGGEVRRATQDLTYCHSRSQRANSRIFLASSTHMTLEAFRSSRL